MKRILAAATLAASSVLSAPSALAAQGMGVPVLTLHTAKTPRVVYRTALDVLLQGGFQTESRSLDELLVTVPSGTSVQVAISRRRDSTEVLVAAVALERDGETRCTSDGCLQRELLTSAMVLKQLEDRLKALRPAPRTAADGLAAAAAFGYAPRNAIRVGGGRERGVQNQHAYLDALRGPHGERVTWLRLGSCCEFSTPNGLTEGRGLLDAYEVTYPGLRKPIVLYLNLYDPPRGTALPPGFTRAAAPAARR